MAVTTGFKFQGVDLGSYFGAKGASTAAATGFKFQGTDLNALLLARADGNDLGFNVNFLRSGSDLRNSFAQPTGNTPLPINGKFYSASASSGTGGSVANLVFTANGSGWLVTRTQSPGGGSGTLDSGSLPAGAVTCTLVLTIVSGGGTGTSSSNNATSPVTLSSGTATASVQANGAPLQPEREIEATLQINFFNGSGTNISQSTITLDALATGSS